MRDDIKYWLGLSKIQDIGAIRFKKLYSHFNSMAIAWQADMNELRQTGLEQSVIQNIIKHRQHIDLDEEMQKMQEEGIKAVTVLDNNYPSLLKQIYNPPAVLYYMGRLEDKADKLAIGVVGTRKFSAYGQQLVENIVGQIAKQGIAIVSGLALGIDSLAHDICLEAGGRTIAVLGSGLDKQNIYPGTNRYLVQKIVEKGGLVMSEYPIGTGPLPGYFVQRNRIIAGLSLATLVIEAPERSGALITARYAVEFNRDVLAIPGNIYDQNAAGTNNLIKLGAKLVSNLDDVLEVLNIQAGE